MSSTVDSRRVKEYADDAEMLTSKIDKLVEMIQSSKNTIFFTGAGVSTSAGIADYRGPTGVWTKQRMKKLVAKASPTASEKAELDLLQSEAKKEGERP